MLRRSECNRFRNVRRIGRARNSSGGAEVGEELGMEVALPGAVWR